MAPDDRHCVLIVDDEEEVLKLMYRQLAQLPYSVIPTTSPAEAIHVLETHEVAVLLCDLNMPHIDGNMILLKAKEFNADTISIAISGGASAEATIKAVNEGGIWKYITKPWKPDELTDLVRSGVSRYDSLRRPASKLKNLARESGATAQIEHEHVSKKPGRVLGKKADLSEAGGGDDNAILSGILADRYEIGGVLGEGGLGIVYKAQDIMLNMPVAVKVLNAEVSNNEKAIATLKEEARIAMQLSHKHIVRLHNLQKEGRHYYLVMEYVQGRTLWDVLDQHGALALDSVCQIIYVCSDAISYAHRRGVLHKDLKPDNVLITEDGLLKIIDFGIACLAKTQDVSDTIMGTPAYMSPEQVRGDILDVRTDVYSMGMIVYELLVGKTPFPEEVTLDTVLDFLPLNISAPQIPPAVAEIIEQALSPDREDRWESIFTFSTALIDASQKLV